MVDYIDDRDDWNLSGCTCDFSLIMVSSFDWSNPQHRKHTISLAAASESVSLLIPFQESFFLHDLDLRHEALADQASGCHPCALAAIAVPCLGRVSALEVQDVCSLFGRTAGTWVSSGNKVRMSNL